MYQPGPEYAVLVDASDSEWTFSEVHSLDETRSELFSASKKGKKLAVWGDGALTADVVNRDNVIVDRIVARDFKVRPHKNRVQCGVVLLASDCNSGLELSNCLTWKDYEGLPGVKVMWVDNATFDLRKLRTYFATI